MPIISQFFGIIIAMYWNDHSPPHFHAKYGEQEIIVEIESMKITGNMSKRAYNMVVEWTNLHREELLSNWELSKKREPLKSIDPLE
ncbi:DUF4160 domain-containing protein [bacterium]|nr:DUF4160 domain-containing protein [bacterium]